MSKSVESRTIADSKAAPPSTSPLLARPTPLSLVRASGKSISFSEALGLLHQVPAIPGASHTTPAPGKGSLRKFSGEVRRDWCAGFVAHGGILTALLLQSVKLYTEAEGKGLTKLSEILRLQVHPISLHLEFLSKTDAGTVTVYVAPVKVGRQYSVFGVKLVQGGGDGGGKGKKGTKENGGNKEKGSERECITGLITYGNMSILENHVDGFIFDPVIRIPNRLTECFKKDLTGNKFIEFGIVGAKLEYYLPIQSEEEREKRFYEGIMLEQWVRFDDFDKTGEGFNLQSLGWLVDSYVLLPENLIKNVLPGDFWYPTLSLDLEVKSLPPTNLGYWEWVFMRVSINKVKNGRMDNIVSVYDEKGGMIARASQIGLIVGGKRNVNTAQIVVGGGGDGNGKEAKL